MFSWPRISKSSDSHLPFQFRPCLEVLEDRDLFSVNSLAPMPAPWVQVFHGDFNGDSKQDVAGIDSSGQWWVSLSTGTSFTPRTKWAQWSVPSAWTKLFVADVNGDGKDDIVGFGFNGAWFVGISNGTDAFMTGPSWAQWSIPSTWSQLFVGDFNGDHKADIAGFGNNGAWFVGLSNGTDTFATGNAWANWSSAAGWQQVFVDDFNGDGKADVAGFGKNGAWFVGLSNGVDTFATGPKWAQWSPSSAWSQLFTGDFNGDHKADIAGFSVNGAWFVGLSDGVGQFTTGAAWAQWSPASSWAQVYVGDITGNGKADVLGFALQSSGTGSYEEDYGVWYVGYSNGIDTFTTGGNYGAWSSPNNWAQIFVTDFNGDGKADLGGFATGSFDFAASLYNYPWTNVPAWNVGLSSAGNYSSTSVWLRWT